MSKQITAKEMAEIVTKLLTTDEIDDYSVGPAKRPQRRLGVEIH